MVGTVELCSCVLDLPCEQLLSRQESCLVVADPGASACSDPLVAGQHPALALLLEACWDTLSSISAFVVGAEHVTDLVVAQQLQDLGCVHSPTAAAKYAGCLHSTWKFAAARRPINSLEDAQNMVTAAQANAYGSSQQQGQHSIVQLHLEAMEPSRTITLVGLSGCSASVISCHLRECSPGTPDAPSPPASLSQAVWDILWPYMRPAQLVVCLEDPSFLRAAPAPNAQRMQHVLQEQQDMLDSALLQSLQSKVQLQADKVVALEQDKHRLQEQVAALQAEVYQLRLQQQEQEHQHHYQLQHQLQLQEQEHQHQLQLLLEQARQSQEEQPKSCTHTELTGRTAAGVDVEQKVTQELDDQDEDVFPVGSTAALFAEAMADLQPAIEMEPGCTSIAGCKEKGFFRRVVNHFSSTSTKRQSSGDKSHPQGQLPSKPSSALVTKVACSEESPRNSWESHFTMCASASKALEVAGSTSSTPGLSRPSPIPSKPADTLATRSMETASSGSKPFSQQGSASSNGNTPKAVGPTAAVGQQGAAATKGSIPKAVSSTGAVTQQSSAATNGSTPKAASPTGAVSQQGVATTTGSTPKSVSPTSASTDVEDQLRVWRAALVESRRQVAVLTDRLVQLMERPSNDEVELMQEELILLRQECAAEAVQLAAAKAQVHALTAELRAQSLLVSKLQAQLETKPQAAGLQSNALASRPLSSASSVASSCASSTQRTSLPRSMQPTAASLARHVASPVARTAITPTLKPSPAKPEVAKRTTQAHGGKPVVLDESAKGCNITKGHILGSSTIRPKPSRSTLGKLFPTEGVFNNTSSSMKHRDPAPKASSSSTAVLKATAPAACNAPSRAASAPVDTQPADGLLLGLPCIVTAISHSAETSAPPTPPPSTPEAEELQFKQPYSGRWHVTAAGLQPCEDGAVSPVGRVVPTSYAISSIGQQSAITSRASSAGPASPTASSSEALRANIFTCSEMAITPSTAPTPDQSSDRLSTSSHTSCEVTMKHFLHHSCSSEDSIVGELYELCMPPQWGWQGLRCSTAT